MKGDQVISFISLLQSHGHGFNDFSFSLIYNVTVSTQDPNEWFAFNTHVIYKNYIYFLTQKESGLSWVDAETGKRNWFDDTYDFGNLLRVGNKIIMLSEKGELIWGELDAAGFEETYRQKILEGLCWSKPILLGNLLYARSAEGAVVCVKLE